MRRCSLAMVWVGDTPETLGRVLQSEPGRVDGLRQTFSVSTHVGRAGDAGFRGSPSFLCRRGELKAGFYENRGLTESVPESHCTAHGQRVRRGCRVEGTANVGIQENFSVQKGKEIPSAQRSWGRGDHGIRC